MDNCECSYEKYNCFNNIHNCRYKEKLIKHFPLFEILLDNNTRIYNLTYNDIYIDIDEFNKLFFYIIDWTKSSLNYMYNINNTQIIVIFTLYHLIISNVKLLETKIHAYRKILYVLYFKLIDFLIKIENNNISFNYLENKTLIIKQWLNILKKLIGGNL